ncbi:IBR finger domain [Cordyceps militaris]|uniref:RBR-type E3 ubiquitin transferase n=1 Tax=Cordyceps militaris TaxID=73501 RepID=A0A2H4SB78_CORMI|nr:IBR finger domain [Cordyceps militaris]
MGSLRITIHSPPKTPDTMATGDIHHDVYAREVLGLEAGMTEDAMDAALVAKANSLGIATSTLQKRTTSSAFSSSTSGSTLDQTFSAASPTSMPATPRSSLFAMSNTDLACSDATGFGLYDQFIAAVGGGSLEQVRLHNGSSPAVTSSAHSVFSVSTNKSFSSVRSGFKSRSWFKKKSDPSQCCHGCRTPAGKLVALHGLACKHTYCSGCMRYVVSQACMNEASMPPRCCSQPFLSHVLQDALDRDTQQAFFQAVTHFSTPKHARIYCPSSECGAFINARQVVHHKHPMDVTCQQCLARACRTCKRGAHALGTDCPQDWELEAVKKMGQGTRWKRCHSCRSLASLAPRRSHIVCRCKEAMCAVCGAIWDATAGGCPNMCSSDAAVTRPPSTLLPDDTDTDTAQTEAETRDAASRAQRCPQVQALIHQQALELDRFCAFAARSYGTMQARHATDKLTLLEQHVDEQDALTARHAKAAAALEDRQIAAEMELRATLEQTARSVNLRLKHMEAYCQGRSSSDDAGRVVTERNLRELGQQYTLRDGMAHQHQAKINVMRERQARRVEELLDRQEAEVETLTVRQQEASAVLGSRVAAEEEAAGDALRALQIRLGARWSLQLDVLCREREAEEGLRYGPVATPAWPQDQLYVEQASPAQYLDRSAKHTQVLTSFDFSALLCKALPRLNPSRRIHQDPAGSDGLDPTTLGLPGLPSTNATLFRGILTFRCRIMPLPLCA